MKKLVLAFAAVASLAACAPMSPYQRAALANYANRLQTQAFIAQQNNAALQQQAIAAWGRTYAQPAPNANTACTANQYIPGNPVYVHCQ
jgi:uncharacterized lipoprotein